MRFDLKATLMLSKEETTQIVDDVKQIIDSLNEEFSQKDEKIEIKNWTLDEGALTVRILSQGKLRAHHFLLQFKNELSNHLGKKHKIGIREILVDEYQITFTLDKKALKSVTIPFAETKIDGKNVVIRLQDTDEEFLRKNYVDRMITLVEEKVMAQYYEGKKEFWNLIWESEEKKPVWRKDPTEEMKEQGWLKQGPSKGKWFFRPQAAAVLRTMEKIAVDEVLRPLGFQEIIESHVVPFEVWLKTGHLEGMPGEFYYVSEPATRDVEKWEKLVDIVKITKKVPTDELMKNIEEPATGICYAQCPVIYWSFKGKTIKEDSLPVLVYDRAANSNRYESGGRHGIERTDEFHRIEPVYIGTPDQLFDIRDELIDRYKHVFNDVLDLEWRMAWVTPWYLRQAGKIDTEKSKEKGTIDFEAYMPYRGSRKESEWLEFQNLSIIGEKYTEAFNIKAQKSELWSGCSGIGLERWATAFLAQKGLDPKKWPQKFKKYLGKLPKGIEFL